MMLVVQLIDAVVEFVKLLVGAPGRRNVVARIVAWLLVLTLVAAAIGLIAWGISLIPTLIDALNGD